MKENFYSRLDKEYEELPKYDMKIVIGDANAKIGKEEEFKPIIGNFSKHLETNENGHLLIDFAREKNMLIKSTYFQRKDIYKGTWKSPDGRTVNQIDHVLIEKDEEKCIMNVRSYRGPDANSDHFLVGIKMKQLIPRQKNQRKKKHMNKETYRLKKEEDKQKYVEQLNKNLSNVSECHDVDSMWGTIKQRMEQAVGTTSKENRKQNKTWFDEECELELEKRKKLRLRMLEKDNRETKEAYRNQRTKVKKIFRDKKRKLFEKIIGEIEEDFKNKQIRNLYQGIRREKRIYRPQTVFVKNKEGELIGGEKEILDQWKQYIEELLNGGEQQDEELRQADSYQNTDKLYMDILNMEENN